MSLLTAHGHQNAAGYPIGLLQDETRIVVERVNNGYATEAVLLQQAVIGVWSKKGNKEFHKTLKELTGEDLQDGPPGR